METSGLAQGLVQLGQIEISGDQAGTDALQQDQAQASVLDLFVHGHQVAEGRGAEFPGWGGGQAGGGDEGAGALQVGGA